MSKKVLVIGGGNIGTEFACEFAAKGYEVNVYTSKPEKYNGSLTIVDSEGNVTCKGDIALATDKLEEAMEDAGLIFVILPSFMFADTAAKMEPYIKEGTCIGVIPGTGGAEFAFRGCINKGAVLFGLQRVPGVARLVEYGRSVCVEGKRDELFLASIPSGRAEELCKIMAHAFDIKCTALPNYLSVTLTPSNPILHTTRLCTLFSEYKEGFVYPENPLFYGQWSMASSELLLKCDDELKDMIRELKDIDLTNVKSLRVHYESEDAPALTRKISSIKSLHDLHSPMKEVEGGWIPDFDSRYFTADFPFGLSLLIELAHVIGVPVPNMEFTMNWYMNITGRYQTFDMKSAGIESVEDIYNLYK